MSLKLSFLIGTIALTSAGLGAGTYFSLESLIRESWDSKIAKLKVSVEKLSNSDYESYESSILFNKVKEITQEMINWLEKNVGEERFKTTFLKLLGYEGLISENLTEGNEIKFGATEKYKAEIAKLKTGMTASENALYLKASQLNEICREIIKKFENSKKSSE